MTLFASCAQRQQREGNDHRTPKTKEALPHNMYVPVPVRRIIVVDLSRCEIHRSNKSSSVLVVESGEWCKSKVDVAMDIRARA
jgi:hypothetical protein